MKIVKKLQLKIVIITAVKNRCMLHGHVFVMSYHEESESFARNPVFGVKDQIRHKPSCTATEGG